MLPLMVAFADSIGVNNQIDLKVNSLLKHLQRDSNVILTNNLF
jgi:hypothetical protein|nr:MAG: hypothetical protein [Bacteriophage sp.]